MKNKNNVWIGAIALGFGTLIAFLFPIIAKWILLFFFVIVLFSAWETT